MTETLTLQQKLLNAQAELKAPKGQFNSFGKYKYRSAEDILEAVKPINAKHGLLLVIYDEPLLIGNRYYIKATAEITDANNTQSYKVTAYAREPETKKGMDDSQITGTASSYARKYALNGLYLIDDTKDADSDEYQKQGGNTKAPQDNGMATKAQLNAIGAKTQNIAVRDSIGQGAVYENAQKALGIHKNTKELTKADAAKFIDYLTTLEG